MNEQHRRAPRRPTVAPVEEPARSPFSGVAARFANWLTGADRFADYDDEDEYEEYDEHDGREGGEALLGHDRAFADRGRGRSLAERGRGHSVAERGRGRSLAERGRGQGPAERGRGPAIADRDRRQVLAELDRDQPLAELDRDQVVVDRDLGGRIEAEPGPLPEPLAKGEPSRFPLVGLGYDPATVDEHIASVEGEIERLRAEIQPLSVSEELERLGEQTASILVVAHDQAQETARLAREQAERCVADAKAEAAAITARASARLRELDDDTDAVWRERERLLEDVRMVSAALAKLAEDASARFPAAPPQETAALEAIGSAADDAFGQMDRLADDAMRARVGAPVGEPVGGAMAELDVAAGGETMAAEPTAGRGGAEAATAGSDDTGSWLNGLRSERP